MSQDALRELTMLCQQLRNAERELADLDESWKAKKEEVRRLTEDDIPSLMSELAVSKITLESGEKIEVKPDVECSIPKEDPIARSKAFEWLEQNGHGSIIKTIVAAQFGRGELELAHSLAAQIAETTGKPATVDRSVHASTLKAFIKEQLAEAAPIPLDLFMARAFNRAKIK